MEYGGVPGPCRTFRLCGFILGRGRVRSALLRASFEVFFARGLALGLVELDRDLFGWLGRGRGFGGRVGLGIGGNGVILAFEKVVTVIQVPKTAFMGVHFLSRSARGRRVAVAVLGAIHEGGVARTGLSCPLGLG